MKKILGVSLAFVMMVGIVFIGDAISSNGNLSVSARQVSVKHKTRRVSHRVKYHSKRVAHHSANGGRWTARKSVHGAKWGAHKTKRGFKKIIQ